MDNDTLNNKDQTNTAAGTPNLSPATADPAPTASLTPPPVDTPADLAAPDVSASNAAADTSAPSAAPDAATPATAPAATPEPATPDPAVAEPVAPSAPASPAAEPAAAPNPFATPAEPAASAGGALDASSPLVGTAPIIGTSPTEKQSPILNSAPANVKKFDPKYMVPIIGLGVLSLGLIVFLCVELFILKPNAEEAARQAGKNSVAANTIYVDASSDDDEATGSSTLTIPYASDASLDGTGTYLLSASGPAGISAVSNVATTVAEFTVNWATAKEAYPDLRTSTGTNTYTVDFNQPITEIFYGTINDKNYYLFLLEDGTVDYLDIEQALENKNFTAAGTLSDVENVVKFLTSTASGTATILAQQMNGDFYDLSSYLE